MNFGVVAKGGIKVVGGQAASMAQLTAAKASTSSTSAGSRSARCSPAAFLAEVVHPGKPAIKT